MGYVDLISDSIVYNGACVCGGKRSQPPMTVRMLQLTVLVFTVALTGCSKMSQKNVILHDVDPMSPAPVTEYLLPCAEMDAEVKESLHPWLRQMVGQSSQGVAKVVKKRWEGIQSPSLKSLRNRVQEFEPRSIVVGSNGAYLCVLRRRDNAGLYIAPPLEEDQVVQCVSICNMQDNGVFREFVQSFAGLRESMPGSSGYFLYNRPTSYAHMIDKSVDGYADWESSKIIYHAINGDSVALRPDGAVAWCVLSEAKMKPLSDDFASFVEHYVRYKEIAWPFDSYGP